MINKVTLKHWKTRLEIPVQKQNIKKCPSFTRIRNFGQMKPDGLVPV